MLAWLILISSGLAFCVIFIRRMQMTRKDLLFQAGLENGEPDQADKADDIDEADGADLAYESDEKTEPELLGSIRKTFLKADTHFSRNEFEAALPLLLAVIESDSSHLDAHHKLGLLFMKTGDFPKAELYFSQLVNLKQDPIYFSNLGAALYQQQRLIEAAEAYENAIALDDKRAERLQSVAQVYYELGNDEKALYYFEKAARRKPKNAELKLILADYYERMVRLDSAIEAIEGVLELDPYNEELKERVRLIRKKAGQGL